MLLTRYDKVETESMSFGIADRVTVVTISPMNRFTINIRIQRIKAGKTWPPKPLIPRSH